MRLEQTDPLRKPIQTFKMHFKQTMFQPAFLL